MVATKGRVLQVQKMPRRGQVNDFKVYTEGETSEIPDPLDKVPNPKGKYIPQNTGSALHHVSDSKYPVKHLEKMKGKSIKRVTVPVGRKALADIGNVNAALSRTEQRKVPRFGYTVDLRKKEPNPPDKPSMGKVSVDLAQAASETKTLLNSVKRSTKVTSSDDKKPKCNHNSLAAGGRASSVRIPLHLTRKSLPTLKQTSQVETRAMTKDSENSEKFKGKHGFLVKSSVGKGIIPIPSNLRSRHQSNRVSDGFTFMETGTQSKVETGLVPRKSLRESVRVRGDLAQAAAETKTALKPFKRNTKFISHETRTKFQARNSLTANSRKSLPALKQVSRVETCSIIKEISQSSQKFNGEHAFPVKSSVRKSNVPKAINLSCRPQRNRVSDGFAVMASRAKNKMEPEISSKKSLMLNVNCTSTTVDHPKKSQPSYVFPMKKMRSSPLVINKIKQKVSISKPSEVLTKRKQNGFPSKDAPPIVALEEPAAEEVVCSTSASNIDSTSSNSVTKRRSSRRNSFTYSLLSGSKENSNITPGKTLPNIYDERNHLEVSDYVEDIYCYYWFMEAHNPPLKNYFEIQQNLTPQMRGILINWLVEVHLKFNLKEETLFLTVTLLDRYLSLQCIKRNEMQLVGLTALLLASKYEDYWHPTVADLTSISLESYTRHQMLQMEKTILKTLKFRLNEPTLYVFMLRFLKAAQLDIKCEHLAYYLIELCLVEYESLNYKPSMLCASAVYVARCTMKIAPAWTSLLTKHTRYNESEIRGCAEMIVNFHKAAKTNQLNVTYDKYRKQDRSRVANIPPLNRIPV